MISSWSAFPAWIASTLNTKEHDPKKWSCNMKECLGVIATIVFLATIVPASKAQRVEGTANEHQTVTFTTGQQEAIKQFLKAHLNFMQADCTTLGLTPSDCQEADKEWRQAVEGAKATPQSPYAAWGNYSHHQSPDLVIPFFGKRSVNNWGWRDWEIVVFEPIGLDQYRPMIAVKDSWGVCFDGMLYHPARKQVEFWCKSMGGSIRWNGTTFVGRIAKGD
jgi:hypothetical protein